jgi:flagellum-specific peptidoglycan hydrolase FlgJ
MAIRFDWRRVQRRPRVCDALDSVRLGLLYNRRAKTAVNGIDRSTEGINVSAKLCNNISAVTFVSKYKVVCQPIADQLNLPVENLLGLAAQESQYGTGRIARELNNYFSMHAPAPLQIGAEAPLGNASIKVAKFDSFQKSAQSFATSFGAAVRGQREPMAFAQALVRSGYNTGNAKTGGRDGFAQYLADIIIAVRGRMAC